eukprot:c43799_g1_i1 orf=149-829(+)
MGGGYKAGRRLPQQRQGKQQQQSNNRVWLLNICITALAAGTLVAFGHWFSARQGRRLGSDKRRSLPRVEGIDDVDDEDRKKTRNRTSPKLAQPMSLADLRQRRLEAVEARLHSTRREPFSARLTPLGTILELSQKADKLEEETNSFLEKVLARVMNPSEEKEQVQLLELLTLLQLDIDAVQGDESVRPHRRSQTNRIQSLIAKLDQLKNCETSTESVFAEAGSAQK